MQFFLVTQPIFNFFKGEFTERRVRSIEPWMDVSSPNGLADVYKLHCGRNGKDMDKSLRDVFIKGNLEDVRNDFQVITITQESEPLPSFLYFNFSILISGGGHFDTLLVEYMPHCRILFEGLSLSLSQTLMDYCCQDVKCTYELLRTLFPLFLDHCPNPVTLAGMLEMGSMYLPVNDSWNAFIQSATYVFIIHTLYILI